MISRKRWALRATLAGVACAILGLSTVAFVEPSEAVVRRVATANASWLLSNYLSESGHPARKVYRKLVGTYVQYGLAAAFRERHPQPDSVSDAERVFRTLVALKATMLNQFELPHLPAQWAPIVSGIGYCDQMNAMAANVLGGHFSRSEIVGLYHPTKPDEHTVGRVWSDRERTWIYFDLWGDVEVFRLDSAGLPVMLKQRQFRSASIDSEIMAPVTAMYRFAETGRPFNEYPRTFGLFVAKRAWRSLARRTLESFRPAGAVAIWSRRSAEFRRPSIEARDVDRTQYLTARLQHVLLGFDSAAAAYREVKAGPTTAIGLASSRFIARPESAP